MGSRTNITAKTAITPANTRNDRIGWPIARRTTLMYWRLARSKLRLNQRKKPSFPCSSGRFRIVAHSAGVKIRATSTESTIDDTMVMENCR